MKKNEGTNLSANTAVGGKFKKVGRCMQVVGLLLVVTLVGCSQAGYQDEMVAAEAEESYPVAEHAPQYTEDALAEGVEANGNTNQANQYIGSSAAKVNKDPNKKFIRTADLKFKAKNVRTATVGIEDIAARWDGYVTSTHLVSNVDYVDRVDFSADSLVATTYFTVRNDMVLRVPNYFLDTALKEMAVFIDYLDHRTIRANDVTLQQLSNRLTERRHREHDERLKKAIDKRGSRLDRELEAEQRKSNVQAQEDAATIAKLQVEDQVAFSTVTMNIYQQQTMTTERMKKRIAVEPFQPGLGQKLKDALKVGWVVIEVIILMVVRLWSLLVLGLIGFGVYWKFIRKVK